jgi:two-component system cell cycle sensor histidine kinase/response regulator CckA
LPKTSQAPAAGAKRRILIVDDNLAIHSDFRKILLPPTRHELIAFEAEVFGEAGSDQEAAACAYELESAHQGEEGVDAIVAARQAGRPFAIAFVDVRMPPGIDGVETAARMLAADADLQIVICTAYSDHSWADMRRRIGESDRVLILRKPFDNIEVQQLAQSLTIKWILVQASRAREEELDRVVQARTGALEARNLQLAEEIRERSAAEMALRASEARHRVLFDGSPLPIWVFDCETMRIRAVNEAMVALLGFSRLELVGMPFADLKPPEDVEGLKRAMAAHQEGIIQVGVKRLRCKDGRQVQLDMTAHEIAMDGRRSMLSTGIDVTHTRRVEEQLRHSQKMEAIGQLAGGVAHDFNNLLAAILMNAELAAAEVGPSQPVAELLQQISLSAERGAQLTGQLLAFSRKRPSETKAVALNTIITELEKMLRRILGEGIDLSTHLVPGLATIQGDPSRIEQVVMNLVVNARDAMSDGGALTIETRSEEFGVAQAEEIGVAPGCYVVLTVADTGCGMDEATRKRIFEPFFTTKDVGKGTGLGLSNVFATVSQSGGAVSVYSEPGRGTTFRLYFPRARDASDAAGETRLRAALGGSETILVAEDDDQLRAVIRRMLGVLGYQCLEARNGDVALDLLKESSRDVHLLLTDLVMPGTDGRTLGAQARKLRPEMKVLVMSGYSGHSAIKGQVIEPNEPFIEKPFTLEKMSRAIRSAIGAPV